MKIAVGMEAEQMQNSEALHKLFSSHLMHTAVV
jgi:hypothetical protein